MGSCVSEDFEKKKKASGLKKKKDQNNMTP
jgi:hypothetical protein